MFIVNPRSHSNEDDCEWEFESVRHSNVDLYKTDISTSYGDSLGPGNSTKQEYEQLTIRGPVSTSTFPTSLRVLFEDNTNVVSSSYRPALSTNISHFSSSPAPTDETLKSPNELALPEGFQTRNPVSSRSTNIDTVQSSQMGRHYDLDSKKPSLQEETTDDTVRIDTETIQSIQTLSGSKTALSPSQEAVESIDLSMHPSKTPTNRYRSRSSVEPSEWHSQDRDLASPAAFRFPLKAIALTNREAEENIVIGTKPTDPTIPSSHQPAHSLDTISRRAALQPFVAPAMHRTRSATAIQPVYTLSNSKASISMNESTHEAQKLPNRTNADRNGLDISLVPNHTLGTPGLKDVLKASTCYFPIWLLTSCG